MLQAIIKPDLDQSHDDSTTHPDVIVSEKHTKSRPMGENRDVDGQRMGDTCVSTHPHQGRQNHEKTLVVATGDEAIAQGNGSPGRPNTKSGLGAVGKIEKQGSHAAYSEEKALCQYTSLSIQEAIRIINGTPLGNVISERQLYRHRIYSKGAFVNDRRINLMRYAAWLFQLRHNHNDEHDISRYPGKKRVERHTVLFHEVMGLLRRQQYRCALSGRRLTPDRTVLDHKLAVSRGGDHCIDNAQILDSDVNRSKYTLTNSEFIALCREVVAWQNKHDPSATMDMKHDEEGGE